MTLSDESPPGKRTIRSFVRRAGRMTASQEKALQDLWPNYGQSFEPTPLDFAQLFGRDAKRTLEIGFGNGDTLVAQAAERPEHDFIGVEVHDPGVGHCLIAARQAEVGNPCR